MAGVVSVWLGELAKFGRPEAAPAAGADADVGRCHRGGDGGIVDGEGAKKGGVQEKRTPADGGLLSLSDAEAVACMLMDRFAPA